MESPVTIGLDLGNPVFQVHGVSAGGAVVVQRRLTRGRLLAFFAKQPACLVVWKPVQPPIIGDESFRSWGTGFACR